MISIIYSTHKDSEYNSKFKEHLEKTIGISDFEILEFVNNNEFSLANIYNKGIEKSKFNTIVCCHNDIKLEKNWGKKLLEDFNNNPDFSIIGKAGSCYFPKSGIYWERMHQTMVGQVYHHPIGQKKWLNKYSPKLPFIIPVVTIDGLFISFDKSKIKHRFDETIGKFHFYDHCFCLPNYLEGIKIGVTSSFEITHESVGQPNKEFFESKELFLKKYEKNLPLDLKPEKVYVPTIKQIKLKNLKKVAIIIPTKSNVNLLFNCIDSFFEKSNPDYFDIFIADTGSSEDEINQIKEKYKENENIKLIEFDYYNFAKINNEVVKNHISDDYEFLLFCNNDIKILNDVVYGFILEAKNNKNFGTLGCRLHYEDNTIEHDGMIFYVSPTKKGCITTHKNKLNYYNFNIGTNENIGNTAGLMFMRKKAFEKIGMFNEQYKYCFEDVELNLLLIVNNFKNYTCSNLVAYHYESQTRKIYETDSDMTKDYNSLLMPVFNKNIEKFKKYLYILKQTQVLD